ncbi:MAG TPA: TraI domain-containing protein [Gammaproteobacteria bacterium]|nr:TraI domain-containing protein [Gammaproteobacteria bacterium]
MSFLKMELANTLNGQQINLPMSQQSKATLYPVLTAEALLAHPKRRLVLEKIKKDCGLELRYYQMCYEPLILHFLELVQALPFQINGGPGTLMDYGLERAELMVQTYKEEAGNKFDAKHAYAVIIAALLQDVGRITSNQKVIISDRGGNFIAYWTPFEGSLVGKGDFYRVRFFENQWVTLAKEVTTLLARQIIPAIGLIWLGQDNRVLQSLLCALNGEKSGGGDIFNWLQLVNKRWQNRPPKEHLPPLRVDSITPQETEIGEAFLGWLNQGLQNGSILVDTPEACVYKLNNGGIFLECPRIFKYFCDAYGERIDWIVPCKQFIALGLTTTTVGTLQFTQFYFKYTKKPPEPSQMAYIFQNQNKQRSAFQIAAKPKVRQPMIREGLVIPPENTGLIYGNIAELQQVVELQPVESITNQQLAQHDLTLLQQQHDAIKNFTQSRTS